MDLSVHALFSIPVQDLTDQQVWDQAYARRHSLDNEDTGVVNLLQGLWKLRNTVCVKGRDTASTIVEWATREHMDIVIIGTLCHSLARWICLTKEILQRVYIRVIFLPAWVSNYCSYGTAWRLCSEVLIPLAFTLSRICCNPQELIVQIPVMI